MQNKVCFKCGVEKLICDFPSQKGTKDGFNPWCKICVSIRSRARRAENPEAARRLDRERYKDPKVAAAKSASFKKWYGDNPDHIKQKSAKYYEKNKDEIATKKKSYREKNVDLIYVANGHRRRGERVAKIASANPIAMASLYRKARYLTKVTGIRHHVDHIVPIKHPLVCGLHAEWNMQVITAAENLKKGNTWQDQN